MNILFIGDIFGRTGRRMVAAHLKRLQSELAIDLSIANVENAAAGFGVTPRLCDDFLEMGVDIMTSGNHVWDKSEIYEYLDKQSLLLRPANYKASLPGKGLVLHTLASGITVAVLNLQGRTHMADIDDPFEKAEELLGQIPDSVRVRFVDFHAEITSEKVGMGWFLDGRVSAVIGTHTHVPTADERVLPKGTALQADAGMTGAYGSIIGATPESALRRFLTGIPNRLELSEADPQLRGAVIDVDEATGQARSIRRVKVTGIEGKDTLAE
ncbi:MAG: TIGR00282 family metallophosphoesterase [Bryobacterales bacterium]|nr:TIGR00282 family metallophosphoesterase [Bryobacterales bacterium]